MLLSFADSMPTSLAIAAAVAGWSPVIITGLIPASMHWKTASLASSLGGSFNPTRPMKIRSLSASSGKMGFLSSLYAKPRTRTPFDAISSL